MVFFSGPQHLVIVDWLMEQIQADSSCTTHNLINFQAQLKFHHSMLTNPFKKSLQTQKILIHLHYFSCLLNKSNSMPIILLASEGQTQKIAQKTHWKKSSEWFYHSVTTFGIETYTVMTQLHKVFRLKWHLSLTCLQCFGFASCLSGAQGLWRKAHTRNTVAFLSSWSFISLHI